MLSRAKQVDFEVGSNLRVRIEFAIQWYLWHVRKLLFEVDIIEDRGDAQLSVTLIVRCWCLVSRLEEVGQEEYSR